MYCWFSVFSFLKSGKAICPFYLFFYLLFNSFLSHGGSVGTVRIRQPFVGRRSCQVASGTEQVTTTLDSVRQHPAIRETVQSALQFNRCLFTTQETFDVSSSDLIGLPRANRYRRVQLPLAVDVAVEPSPSPSRRLARYSIGAITTPYRTAPWSLEARIRLPYQHLSTRAPERPCLHPSGSRTLGHNITNKMPGLKHTALFSALVLGSVVNGLEGMQNLNCVRNHLSD